jgi:hypothetical protein
MEHWWNDRGRGKPQYRRQTCPLSWIIDSVRTAQWTQSVFVIETNQVTIYRANREGQGLRPLTGWDSAFESRRGHGCLYLLCIVRHRFLRRADHSSRGVLPSVGCPKCVIAKPHKGRPWPEKGMKRHRKKMMGQGNNRCLFWDPYKHVSTRCGQNIEFLNVELGGTYIYHWTLNR